LRTTRVVSLEISGGKILEIYPNLSGNFWKFVKEFFSLYTF